ncbi:MAG TPA: cysteine rich repeat-containing protein [Xanthobacteraceae bacterium]
MGTSEHLVGGIVGLPKLRGAIVLLAVSLLGASSAFAQDYRGSSDQQSACMSDVFRLCSGDIPDVGRIVACLKRERPRLSDGCRAVFGGASTRVASNHRVRRHHQSGSEQQYQAGQYPRYGYQGYYQNW